MKNNQVKYLTLAALLGALTFVCGFIKIPLWPVPVTLQTFGSSLTGLVLPNPWGAAAMFIHMVLQMIFSGANPMTTPSFGFIIGFMITAMAVAYYLRDKNLNQLSTQQVLVLTLIGYLTPYLIGLPYMMFILNVIMGSGMSFVYMMYIGMIVFIPGDLIKWFLALFVAKRLNKHMK